MHELATRHCIPGARRLSADQATGLLGLLGHDWTVTDERLHRRYKLKNFASALALVNEIGTLAEAENHHPDITLGWGKVAIELWTHDAGGLTENDFVLAAQIERAFQALGSL